MAKVINRRRKNNVALRLFNDEYEFLSAGQKTIVNKNLQATSKELGDLESEIYEKQYAKDHKHIKKERSF